MKLYGIAFKDNEQELKADIFSYDSSELEMILEKLDSNHVLVELVGNTRDTLKVLKEVNPQQS